MHKNYKSAPRPGKNRAGSKRGRIKAADALRPAEVQLLRDLYEYEFWSIDLLADKFEITVSRVQNLVTYKVDR